jgi:DNA-binding NarL/FixJ family response regulator
VRSWNEQGAALDFSIAPAYYQTRWFKAIVVATVLAMVWATYVVRLRQVALQYHRRLDERVNERTRIARDLHDTLLQSFHGLLLRFQTASYLLPERPAAAKEKLDDAIARPRRRLPKGATPSRVADVDDQTERSRVGNQGTRRRACHQHEHRTASRLPGRRRGQTRDLHPIIRDDIYKIAAEALRNAFRHADPGHVEVEIRYDDTQFRLRVRDDGKGIDAQVLATRGIEGHFGLRGMPERATLIGGELAIWSEVEAGTEVELRTPGQHRLRETPAAVVAVARSGLENAQTCRRKRVMSGGSSPIRILAVDDHPLVRQGIAGLVEVQPDMAIVAEAATGREAIQQFRAHRPDVTLMDIQMPDMNGLDALIAIRTEFPDAKLIVLTTYEGDVHILRALKAGAQGLPPQEHAPFGFAADNPRRACWQEALVAGSVVPGRPALSGQALTPAEVVVLRLIAEGNANKEIADRLAVTEDTIKGRVKSILAKLGANDRTHAAIIGLRRGIIEL